MQTTTESLCSQEVSLLSAQIVDSRVTYRDGRDVVECKLQIETNTRGSLFVWHRYSTFQRLVALLQSKSGYKRKEIPELPSKQLFGNLSEKTIQERVQKLNEFLDATTKADHLQWGIRVDDDMSVYKRRVKNPPARKPVATNEAESADAELRRENARLKEQIKALQNDSEHSEEVALISAHVIDCRIMHKEGKKFVQYKMQLDTDTRGTLFVWHRYSTFRNLAATLQTKHGYKRKEIPTLPSKQLFGNFSLKTIERRLEKLNQFIEAATKAEHLKWGIRVDEDTCVYKRRVKHGSKASNATPSSSPAPLFGMPPESEILVVD